MSILCASSFSVDAYSVHFCLLVSARIVAFLVIIPSISTCNARGGLRWLYVHFVLLLVNGCGVHADVKREGVVTLLGAGFDLRW